MHSHSDPKKTKDLPVDPPAPLDPKAPRPTQQSQIDIERSEGEGMGLGRLQPELKDPATPDET